MRFQTYRSENQIETVGNGGGNVFVDGGATSWWGVDQDDTVTGTAFRHVERYVQVQIIDNVAHHSVGPVSAGGVEVALGVIFETRQKLTLLFHCVA